METEKITLKKYLKNIYGMAIIVCALPLLVKDVLWMDALLFFGVFLIIEHIYSWGEFSFRDLLGHEWFGLIIICLINIYQFSLLGLILVLIGCIINVNFKTPFKNEINILRKHG